MRKLNVLFILPDLDIGGAEVMVLNLLRDLDSSRFEPTLFLLKRDGVQLAGAPEDSRIVWAIEGSKPIHWNAHRILPKLFKYARQSDVIVGVLPLEPTYLAGLCGKMLGKPAIGRVPIAMEQALARLSGWHRRLVRLVYPQLTRIVVVAQGAAVSLARVVKLDPGKVVTIPSYVNWGCFEERAAQAIPAQLTEALAKPTVVAVGRLVEQKGFDLLIRAHARLRASGSDHNLLIVGDGPSRAKLEGLATSLDVRASVFMPGSLPNPYPLMKAASVFVLSSRFEGLSLVLVEALGAGAPVVAADCQSGTAEVLDNGRCGLLVPPGNEAALADGIARLLADPGLRSALKAAGPSRARFFARENIVPCWERLLLEVTMKRH